MNLFCPRGLGHDTRVTQSLHSILPCGALYKLDPLETKGLNLVRFFERMRSQTLFSRRSRMKICIIIFQSSINTCFNKWNLLRITGHGIRTTTRLNCWAKIIYNLYNSNWTDNQKVQTVIPHICRRHSNIHQFCAFRFNIYSVCSDNTWKVHQRNSNLDDWKYAETEQWQIWILCCHLILFQTDNACCSTS